MILTYQQRVLHEVKLAFLTAQTGEKDRYFSTSEQLTAYLKNRPDIRFHIYATTVGSELSHDPEPEGAYGGVFGDVFYGDEVFYDSVKGCVVTYTQTGRIWGG